MLGLLRALGRRRLEHQQGEEEERSSSSGRRPALRLLDIGGGRGDLALAIGACLGGSLGGGVDVHVLVLDINPRSLEQGEARAKEAGLLADQAAEDSRGGGLKFMACDVADQAAVAHCLAASGADGGDGGVDIVTGLHCCVSTTSSSQILRDSL